MAEISGKARAGIDVVAGVLPGTPEPEYTKRFFLTSEEWDGGSEKGVNALVEMNGKAQAHAMMLMLQPHRLNWVKTEWIWF